ncbi:helix-turn-helix domain-containing protein [Streptomyces sp. NRRL F-5630]|uniref:helix-turn-helix domain-containing protein n=1 Tax=Streptomyces sp. NRRL F-5630 TaxID=1463864 RepID=UPI003D739817
MPIRDTPCPFPSSIDSPLCIARRPHFCPGLRRGKRAGGALTAGGSNRLLTPEEVAAWLKVSEITVKNKYRAWGLKPQKVGRLLRFRERDIVSYLDRNYG